MKNPHAVKLGRKGGEATKVVQPPGFYKRISKLGVEARRKNNSHKRTVEY